MTFVDDLFKGGNVVTGLAIGAVAVIALPAVGSLMRPVTKAVIKGIIWTGREATTLYEGTVREIGDLAREAIAELGPDLAEKAASEVGTEAATDVGANLVKEAI